MLPVHSEEGAKDGLVVVAVAGDGGSLHAPPHDVQRVGGGLAHQARHRSEHHPLQGVGLVPVRVFCMGVEGSEMWK